MLCKRLTAFGKRLAMLLSVVTLAACQTTASGEKTTINTLAFCDAAKAVLWSKKDTLKTIVQVKEHNAIGAKACGWK
jgi:hypothetical protein